MKTWFTQTLDKGDQNFLEQARMTSEIIKEPITAQGEEVPDLRALMRVSDKTIYRVVPEDFEVLQINEFHDLVKQIAPSVHSAGQTENGEIVWFTALPPEQYQTFQVNNEIYQNFILFALSYNADIGVSITPVSLNTTRNIEFNITEMLQIKRTPIRQSKNIKVRAKQGDEFKEVYEDCLHQFNQFKGKLRTMSHSQSYDFDELLEEIIPTPKSENKRTRVEKLKEEIKENHESQYGTSLYSMFIAIYATDIAKHDKRRVTLARRFFSGKMSDLAPKVIEKAA